MKLFDVYPLFNIEITKGKGCHVWDKEGNEYLDLYGGHAVISVGHAHPAYVKAISEQVAKLGFYSNSVINSLQQTLADKLGKASGYDDYALFLINSGAEANENALKLASFHNGKKRVLAFKHAFHGRTSAAVRVTDNPKIIAPVNEGLDVTYLPLNDLEAARKELAKGDVSSVIIEGIQGVGGIQLPTDEFMVALRALCTEHEAVLILDEIQSGYGRSGKFFAHQYAGIRPDIITVAKGIANGFPMGAVLISPMFKPVYGMLGTTFGGNHLACAAAISVLDIMAEEHLEPSCPPYVIWPSCPIMWIGTECIRVPEAEDVLHERKSFLSGVKTSRSSPFSMHSSPCITSEGIYTLSPALMTLVSPSRSNSNLPLRM